VQGSSVTTAWLQTLNPAGGRGDGAGGAAGGGGGFLRG